jgi:hypothetical protein
VGPLLGAILTLGTFGVTLWLRRRSGRPVDQTFALKLVGISAGVGSVSIGAVHPLAYVLISKAIYGGTIATNLPTGVTEDVLLASALVGGAVLAIGVIYGLYDHLKS